MPGNFEFLAGKFPELADYGSKAEKYLYTDNEVCMFFISRIFDNAVKYICNFNDMIIDGTNLAEPINELFQKKAVNESIYLLLEMMRIFRNGNAHNKNYSLNDSMILLQMSHILCEWLMTEYGNTGYQRRGFIMPAKDDFSPGEIVECTASNVMSYGVFVSVGNMKGLIHKTEIPSGSTKGYNIGDKITAKILSIDPAKGHAALSISQIQPSLVPKPTLPAMSDEEFMKLCSSGTPAQIVAAIKTGININAADSNGMTPLMFAAKTNEPSAVNILLNAGANIKPKDQSGKTALDWAKINPKLQSSKILKHL